MVDFAHSTEATINASPQAIFDIVSNPALQFNRDSPDQTNFPGNSSFWDTVKYNPAFQGRQMRPDSLKSPVFI